MKVERRPVTFPTYVPAAPSRHPMFFERRVYQGSSGRVYPLPFYDRIAEAPVPRAWDAIHLENDFLYVLILPELGGRIHAIRDKANGYDAVYNQTIIKPALVGLAGPWVSGGIEFNWPQHHRPATYMPVEAAIEHGADGSVTVWLGDHDPMARLKGMHGVCLHPDRALLEVKGRAHNRTDDVQTFLWWANVATKVHEDYQSFFPPDVHLVADHAKRAVSTFPCCDARYYGVDYGRRGREGVPASEKPRKYPQRPDVPVNDLSWYANIPVPTSYMAVGSRFDFSGGYDHRRRAGLMQVVDHHIAPGKKQWTWGNHEFGYAWDRNLTEPDESGTHAPYIEIMVGVYTDNQPDFSFLEPGETKTWSQYWYPFREIGPARAANVEGALSVARRDGRLVVGVFTTRDQTGARLELGGAGQGTQTLDCRAGVPVEATFADPGVELDQLELRLVTAGGKTLVSLERQASVCRSAPLQAAREPLLPADVKSSDELYHIGVHLEQYRHATRYPEAYWREALRRDAGDARCNLALGRWHLRRGEFVDAEKHLRASLARQTWLNPNPAEGETLYQLGRCLRAQGRLDEAYESFFKATWNQSWAFAGRLALGEIDATRGRWEAAAEHLRRALRLNADHLWTRSLLAVVYSKRGYTERVKDLLAENLSLDPLDVASRWLRDGATTGDLQARMDVAYDFARAGLFEEALRLLEAVDQPGAGTAPVRHYLRAWLCARAGDNARAAAERALARAASLDYCFPSRVEEETVLRAALEAEPGDGVAAYLLGNLLYDRRRHEEAISAWELAAKALPTHAGLARNLGIAYLNVRGDADSARAAYDRAVALAPDDARLRYEHDQLAKRLGVAPAERLAALQAVRALVAERDDLTLEYASLLNLLGRHREALELLLGRKFQPWEGGEGLALSQYVAALLGLSSEALRAGRSAEALVHAEAALQPPETLGEAWHLLANPSDVHLAIGDAASACGDVAKARAAWTRAAQFEGDFQEMSVRPYSEKTVFSALAWRRLGDPARAASLLAGLGDYARTLRHTPAKIDYFATSLPTLLLFNADLQARQVLSADFMEAQAEAATGRPDAARKRLAAVLARDPAHAGAAALLAQTVLVV